MKKILVLLILLPLIGSAQFKNLIKIAKEKTTTFSKPNNELDISDGLKEALNKGITEQVSKLMAPDGFYKNEAVKIIMPEELQKVDATLRKLGFGNLADEGIKSLNRAAEDAVKEASPIFVNAIKNMTVNDAKGIVLGADNAATTYLKTTTNTDLYAKFNPVVQQSIGKVGADKVWASIIKKYNGLPFISKVNPDINDYVTQKTLDGVYKMIAVEEKNIRSNLNARTTELLKKVFALQD